ncbi:MAG: flagellar hook-length control protein FliK [Chromatiales bacterium]|nr:flagellar hook-length control protein FliK [Chromatiales bacterium]
MSELSLNVVPSPELLKAAAAGGPSAPGTSAPDRATRAPEAPNPFAALLSGVLQGAQPLPESPVPGTEGPAFALLAESGPQPDTGTVDVLALPGTATALPAMGAETSGGASGTPAGNLLPATGKDLPLVPTGTQAAPDISAGLTTRNEATADETTTPATSRPRIFLADLALSRPLEPATGQPAGNPGDEARTAAAATLAGRAPSAGADGERTARSSDPARRLAPAGYAPLAVDSTGLTDATAASDGLAGGALAGGDVLAPRSLSVDLPFRSGGLPGAGTEFLAGQLAAFAASSDRSNPGTGLSALSGTGTTDAGSAALLGRLGSTGLPPLQPLGNAIAFAGGLADRLLTLGGPGAHSARLKLHPEHLGELDVEISIEDGTARVWFGTTTGQARDAIEASLPRLRELFAEQGIQLTRTQIDAGGGQMGNSAFGQERRMTGGSDGWRDIPAWRPGRAGASAEPGGGIAAGTSARLLDVWA